MRALVVFDSKFGNTREIALRIGQGLREEEGTTVDVQSTSDLAGIPDGLDLLVIGAPTQAHGVETTMRQFLGVLSDDRLHHLRVAVFDTRMHWPKLISGSAADGIARHLDQHGAELIDDPESFFVDGREGPLREGETGRAADWGRYLLGKVTTHA